MGTSSEMAGAAINQSLPAGGRLLHRTQSDEECDIMIGALRIELDGIRVSGECIRGFMAACIA